MSRLVLVDRDGTLIVEKNYLSSPSEVELIPGTAEGIKLLRSRGFKIVIVTNQSGIGRGYFDIETLAKIHARLIRLLREEGAEIDGIYFCPHTPADNCQCRKPLPEMAERAAHDFQADLKESFVIGDNLGDINLGKNIGAKTILVQTGYGATVESEKLVVPDFIAENFYEAACLIEEEEVA